MNDKETESVQHTGSQGTLGSCRPKPLAHLLLVTQTQIQVVKITQDLSAFQYPFSTGQVNNLISAILTLSQNLQLPLLVPDVFLHSAHRRGQLDLYLLWSHTR